MQSIFFFLLFSKVCVGVSSTAYKNFMDKFGPENKEFYCWVQNRAMLRWIIIIKLDICDIITLNKHNVFDRISQFRVISEMKKLSIFDLSVTVHEKAL